MKKRLLAAAVAVSAALILAASAVTTNAAAPPPPEGDTTLTADANCLIEVTYSYSGAVRKFAIRDGYVLARLYFERFQTFSEPVAQETSEGVPESGGVSFQYQATPSEATHRWDADGQIINRGKGRGAWGNGAYDAVFAHLPCIP